MFDERCPHCGFNSDDQIEYANHLRDRHLDGSAWVAWLRGEHWIAGVDVMHEADAA